MKVYRRDFRVNGFPRIVRIRRQGAILAQQISLRIPSGSEVLLLPVQEYGSAAAAGEEACYDDQEHGADGRGSKRINESSAEDSELREEPSSENRPNEPQNNVCDAAEAVSARDFPRQPARDQADEEPANQAMAKFNDPYACLKRSRKHRASRKGKFWLVRHILAKFAGESSVD